MNQNMSILFIALLAVPAGCGGGGGREDGGAEGHDATEWILGYLLEQ